MPASNPDNDIVGLVVDGQDRVTLATLYDDYDTIALHRFTAGVADRSFGDRWRGPRVLARPGRRRSPWTRSTALVLTGLVGFRRARSSSPASTRPARSTRRSATVGSGATWSSKPAEEEGNIVYDVFPADVWVDAGRPAGGLRPGATDFADDYFVVGRYLVDGTPDPTLDGNGFQLTPNTSRCPRSATSR